jgi:hypothetical protein
MYGIYVGGNIIAQFAAPMTVRSNRPVFSSDTLSLDRVGSKRPNQRWEIETRLVPLSSKAEDLFIEVATKGYTDLVQVVMPQNYGTTYRRTSTGNPTATGTIDTNIVTVAGNTGLIPKGSFIKVGSHFKIYMTTQDRSGDGTVTVFPNLLANLSGVLYREDDVIGTFKFDLDTITGMAYTDGILMDLGTVKLVEHK